MSIDLIDVDWLGRGWLLTLAFTLGTVWVALMRRPSRRLFGPERAFQLWLLPPLAMLASQLPHGVSGTAARLPDVVFAVTAAVDGWSAQADPSVGIDWRRVIGFVWLGGVVASMAHATWAQRRYRARLAEAWPATGVSSTGRVLRAVHHDLGPALVGAWRARIVLPADFVRRYDATERRLIVAHEAMHARRGDGWWCLIARGFFALFWFHPLAWWALAALRHDQELACDAAVLRRHGNQRRAYATAMLKTQSAAIALPVGCTWSPRHPLTERVAMLKLPLPTRRRRHVGALVGLAVISVVTGAVHAVSAPAAQRPAAPSLDREYQLDLTSELATDDAVHGHAERARLAVCMAPGEAASVRTHGWEFRTVTVPDGSNRVRIQLTVLRAGSSEALVSVPLHAVLGQPTQARGAAADGRHRYAIELTPHAGCPARAGAPGHPAVMVSERVTKGTARAVALSVASKAGWVLSNPDALGTSAVTLDFRDMPADRAMWLVADIVGMRPVFEGNRVRFERK